jgi:hypothetical protein
MKSLTQSLKCTNTSVVHLDIDVGQEKAEVMEGEVSLETTNLTVISETNQVGKYFIPLEVNHENAKSDVTFYIA